MMARKISYMKIAVWVMGLILTVCMYHVILSLVLTTDTDRAVAKENRMYEELYSEMRSQERLLRGTIRDLELRDDEIYNNLFNTSVPSLNDLPSVLLSDDAENLKETDIFSAVAFKINKIESSAQTVEDNFRRVFELCGEGGVSVPPMVIPVEGFSVARTGASVGMKVSPFYKVASFHDGLDLIAPVGTNVLAGGAGVVMKVDRSTKADGTVVIIDHGNGYTTRYSHLATVNVVSGRKVKAGTKIGTVGMTGKSFAPHLHYVLMHDGNVCDPVNYLFSSITPQEYATMLVLSSSTAQQMD